MNPARLATAVVVTTTGALLTTAVAAPTASAATTCAAPVYQRQIFANTTFSGTPKKAGCDAAIAENWGTGAPAPGVPSNDFSVRWTVTRDFGSGGPFAFTAAVQDGLRVYVDGVRKVNLWKNGASTVSRTVDVTVPAGKHTLRIDYANWTGRANVKFGYAPRTSASVDKVKPLAPTGLVVGFDPATARTDVVWAKNKEMDVAGYRVYRRGENLSWRRLAATTKTSYTDTPPADGLLHQYEVRAYDKAGNESAGSVDRAVVTLDRTPPAVPTGISAFDPADGAHLSWGHVQDAVSYRVYRSPEPDGVFTYLGAAKSGSSYRDTTIAERAAFYYRVSAVDAAGNESQRSGAVKASRGDGTAPPALTGLAVTPTEYGFRLTWDATPATDVEYYRVYRGEVEGEGEDKVCSSYEAIAFVDTPADTSFDVLAVPDGEESCFFVDVVDDHGNSPYGSTGRADTRTATELDMTPSVPTPGGSPLQLTVDVWQGSVWLDWTGLDESSPEAAGGYRVYRWNPAASAYEKLADVPSDYPSYNDLTASRGTTHHYRVTSVAADGTESQPVGGALTVRP
ncbi:fibronectin type III domain-containing protein [Streptomyces sp. NPDC002755]|uniref:fibronectin type III domain-containing protein n=1 Tax=Streptomyces sp. NPDC002884 TaxID=3154544 RepID=UPI00332CFE4F